MEPEGSLPQSQVPSTCTYPDPDRSSPYPPHVGTRIEYNNRYEI